MSSYTNVPNVGPYGQPELLPEQAISFHDGAEPADTGVTHHLCRILAGKRWQDYGAPPDLRLEASGASLGWQQTINFIQEFDIMFRGSLTALVTPFARDGSLDKKAFRELVEWQIAEGSNGLVPVGTTGESPTLTHEEH
ncbi:MAG: dihydrodipicolinate synthase family protein, partial [Pseudomonadota bacterium]|nr:dihydrodipicolinate synthase family protein [Pseudomonadota bacterium]